MGEMKAVAAAPQPAETLLVVDALTGQDAVNVAKGFAAEVDLTGVILTRMDGDARGGAALSMRAVTGKPIKFAGVGEKLDKLEAVPPRPGRRPDPRHGRRRQPGRAGRRDDHRSRRPKRSPRKMAKGKFDLDDLRAQLRQMERMGGLGALAGMMPGMKKAKQAMAQSGVDDKVLVHMDAIIGSMTRKERARPELINAKRKKRVAAGSGTDRAGGQQAPQDAPGNGDARGTSPCRGW